MPRSTFAKCRAMSKVLRHSSTSPIAFCPLIDGGRLPRSMVGIAPTKRLIGTYRPNITILSLYSKVVKSFFTMPKKLRRQRMIYVDRGPMPLMRLFRSAAREPAVASPSENWLPGHELSPRRRKPGGDDRDRSGGLRRRVSATMAARIPLRAVARSNRRLRCRGGSC